MPLVFVLFIILFAFSASSHADADTFRIQTAKQHVALYGFTRAARTMPLISEVSGKVLKVNSDIGEAIPESGIFTCLDDTFTQLDKQANQIEQKRLRTDVAYYQKETQRQQKLIKRKSTSQSDLDAMQRLLTNTRQQLKVLKIEQKRLQERLSRFCIQAPTGWRVISRHIEPGQWVSTGQTLATIGDFQRLHIPLLLSPQELAALQQQAQIQVTLADVRQGLVQAKIAHIAPDFDEQTRKTRVELVLSESLAVSRGGLRVHLQLELDDHSKAFVVPDSALQTRYDTSMLQRENGQTVSVVILGQGAVTNTSRIVSPEIHAGDVFMRE
ncbi:efflux RND transporter periplasmic adaptor subunit [Candidatus Venteria ishoeyi]|uniref:efflux RND transporter periplasmic adaptor subunit n=1 Tax=Candidatus Venteria ishoeyi TaxID=1899563 RepID=UPI0025A67C3D|nr:efflux RND transporter periplasmic adaptor subunit [Candidatus Venteria ishoeyi]MDM8546855.1 efflux RND transporter periplasmic adaptor subunit [Candidatus Venteria ishoeyi]